MQNVMDLIDGRLRLFRLTGQSSRPASPSSTPTPVPPAATPQMSDPLHTQQELPLQPPESPGSNEGLPPPLPRGPAWAVPSAKVPNSIMDSDLTTCIELNAHTYLGPMPQGVISVAVNRKTELGRIIWPLLCPETRTIIAKLAAGTSVIRAAVDVGTDPVVTTVPRPPPPIRLDQGQVTHVAVAGLGHVGVAHVPACATPITRTAYAMPYPLDL